MPSTRPIIRGSGPRAGFPDYLVKRLKRDKLGILSGVTQRHFQVGEANQRIQPAWLTQANAPDPGWGIPCIDCDSEIKDGMCIVTYNHEGADGDYSFSEDAITYELDTSMEDEPIETHPFIQSLIATFGWDSENKTFAEFLAADPTGQTGLSGGKKAGKRNPLFGTDSWRVVGAVFRKTYAARTVPPSVYRGWGTIIESPDGLAQLNMPAQPKRPWLRLAPKITKRGNAVQISEEALLGKPGGKKAASIIYNAAQLDT